MPFVDRLSPCLCVIQEGDGSARKDERIADDIADRSARRRETANASLIEDSLLGAR